MPNPPKPAGRKPPAERYVVAVPDPDGAGGPNVYGPFTSMEVARRWGIDNDKHLGGDWYTIILRRKTHHADSAE